MKEEDYIRESLNYHLKLAEILSFIVLTLTLAILTDSMKNFFGEIEQMKLVFFEITILLLFGSNELYQAKKCMDKLERSVN